MNDSHDQIWYQIITALFKVFVFLLLFFGALQLWQVPSCNWTPLHGIRLHQPGSNPCSCRTRCARRPWRRRSKRRLEVAAAVGKSFNGDGGLELDGYLMGMSGVCIETWNAQVLKMTVAWSLFRFQKSFLASGKVTVKICRGQAVALERSKYSFVLHLAPSKMLLSVFCSTLHRKGRTVNQHCTIVYTLNSESKIIEYRYTYVEHYRYRSIWKNHQHWQPKLPLASDCN